MKLNKDSHSDIAGFMGPGTEIQGELRFQDAVRVDGKFNGMVESAGSLLVGETRTRKQNSAPRQGSRGQDRSRLRHRSNIPASELYGILPQP